MIARSKSPADCGEAICAATLTAQSPLTTTFADNNGQDGNMFDVVQASHKQSLSLLETNAGTSYNGLVKPSLTQPWQIVCCHVKV